MNRVDVSAESLGNPPWLERLEAFACKAMDKLGLENWDLSILLCDDAYIHELNRQYRDKDEPTDVLSFESGGTVEDREAGLRYIAGDIVISMETLERNANYFAVDHDEEFRRLIIHGILHLSGLDHEDNSPDRPMLRKQEEVLASMTEERIFS